jgi:hypothetical protein
MSSPTAPSCGSCLAGMQATSPPASRPPPPGPPAPAAEVDTRADVESGETPGAKRAAVRKLLHELGIPPAQLPLEQFKFLTRLHYCAADTGGRRQPRAWAASGATQGLAWGCGFREGLRPSCGRRLPSLRGGSRMPLTCTARDTFCPGLPWQAHGARRRSGGSTRWTTSCL